ncbi:thioredoxin domain-containing protein [Maricaulis sp.]|uniref:thioredoxin domain-containing protein n=1 Tax=Maricaulis sp. TaxID=1486257 RepID=UPI001B24C0B3|nr:thioredoxin domain-containing protein [Maricaulis sp.]MBO6797545.1 thioredoxin domain-containing protein [Maricaulis sp.]
MSVTRRFFTAVTMTASLALAACGGGSNGSIDSAGANERSLGSADAPVTMIEYASVSCGHCATFHEEVWDTLETDFISTGQIRFVMREMLSGEPRLAAAGFALAHCVSDDRYFDMISLLMQQQRAIFQAASQPGGARRQYVAIARSMGLSESEMDTCLNDESIYQSILDSHERAGEAGITGTPRFVFNGQLLDSERDGNRSVFTLGGNVVLIDGEPVDAIVDAETFSRLINHLVQQASSEG